MYHKTAGRDRKNERKIISIKQVGEIEKCGKGLDIKVYLNDTLIPEGNIREEFQDGKSKKVTLSDMLFAIGLILPFFIGQIPAVGKMLLP